MKDCNWQAQTKQEVDKSGCVVLLERGCEHNHPVKNAVEDLAKPWGLTPRQKHISEECFSDRAKHGVSLAAITPDNSLEQLLKDAVNNGDTTHIDSDAATASLSSAK